MLAIGKDGANVPRIVTVPASARVIRALGVLSKRGYWVERIDTEDRETVGDTTERTERR